MIRRTSTQTRVEGNDWSYRPPTKPIVSSESSEFWKSYRKQLLHEEPADQLEQPRSR